MTEFRKWFIAAASLSLSIGTAGAQAPYLISTFAGGLTSPTAAVATAYSLRTPHGVAADRFGNLYVSTSQSCIFRLDANGNLSRVAGTCQAGFSGDGGSALLAQLNNPQGLAVDTLGNLYISDMGNQRIRKVTPAGIVSTVAGTGVAGYSADNVPATNSQLNNPQGVAVDAAGNLYIADSLNFRVRQVVPNGTISTIAGTATPGNSGDGGPATAATLSNPVALALDSAGNLYIGDSGSNEVRKIAPGGTITLVAGTGTPNFSGDSGPATAADINQPQGLAVDAAGNLYIADRGNFRVREVSPAGTISTYAGDGAFGITGDHGPATSAELSGPSGVAVDYNRNLYIADISGRIRMVNAAGTITTAAGQTNITVSGDGGPASFGQFTGPWGVTRDGSGNLYVADYTNNRVRKINPAGIITTFAGTGVPGETGDGGPATSASVGTFVTAADPLGNIYLADVAKIRKVVTGGTISTVAGTGGFGYNGDNQPATSALLGSYLPGLAVDSNFNIYISDWLNQRVRKVTAATGVITTIAGTGASGYNGDNQPATSAQVSYPAGLALDSLGNLYIADYNNNRVRKLALNGTISTVAGNGTATNTGDGLAATNAGVGVLGPWGLAVDGLGNLYISTQGNTIRMVSAGGIISTIAGTGVPGYSGDGGLAAAAEIWHPLGLALDPAGNIYFGDFANNAVRVLQPAGTEPVLSVSSTHTPGIFPAPGTGANYTLTVSNAAQAGSTTGTVTVTDTLPSALTFVSVLGSGWNCSALVCTNSSAVLPGHSYSTIDVVVNVPIGAEPQVTNLVTVSGGGALGGGSDDVTFVGASTPVLEVAATHSGDFGLGRQGTYIITVGNQPSALATGSPVTVQDNLPSGLTLVSMTSADNAWICSGNTCTESNPLGGGAAYSPITVTVNVASNAPSSVINSVTASGGGSASATATDTTNIVSAACAVTGDSTTSVADVQAVTNQALGTSSPTADLNQDHVVNVVDIQIVINAALHVGCTL
jgi:trimeric autotransporter adhesin